MNIFTRQATASLCIRSCVLAFFALFVATLSAQGQVFSLVHKKSPASETATLSNYKYEVANKVYKQLISTLGDKSRQVPDFVMRDQACYGAWFDPALVQVGLEEAAYDICTSLGKDSLNAMAALLAHELSHYYEQHDLDQHFSKENKNLETGLQQEMWADYAGGLLRHFSGFNNENILPDVLKMVYAQYKIPKKISGYPTLNERISASDTAQANIKAFLVKYETCNILTILAEYETAAAYYTSILKDFQSVEMLHNAGLITMMAALDYMDPKEMPYILPTEMTPNARLNGTTLTKVDTTEKGRALLLSALQLFDSALAFNADDINAYLNKGTILALLHEYDAATVCILEGKKRCSTQRMSTDFLVMEGIIEAMRGKNSIAVQHFSAAKTIGSYLAVQNLNIVRNIKPPALIITEQVPADGDEQIEWYSLSDFYSAPQVGQKIAVDTNMYCGIQQKALSTLYLHDADHGKQRIAIQETSPLYTGSSQSNIKLGSTADIVQESYGVPKRNIIVAGQRVWVYPEMRLFFRFNNSAVVESWGIYWKGL